MMSMQPVGPVVVGVDGTDAALTALDLAAEEAAARITPLTVVHVVPADVTADAPARAGHADRVLTTAADRARVEHPALAVAVASSTGDPAHALLRAATNASMLVLGHRGRRPGVRRTDTVTERILEGSHVPVVIHRPFDAPAPGVMRPVVVGLADPVDSDVLLAFAFEEAALRGAPLLAMHVRPGAYQGPDVEALATAVGLWAEKYPEVPVRRVLRRGVDVAVAITAVSHAAQLIVVGVPRRIGASVTDALVHRTGCPVAVVPLHRGSGVVGSGVGDQ
jgi:nucleotide-binding universal stress UspA family protein